MLDRFVPGIRLIPAGVGPAFMRAGMELLASMDAGLGPGERARVVEEKFPGLLTTLYAKFGILKGDGTVLRPPAFMMGGKPAPDQFWVLLPMFVEDSITLVVVRTPPLPEITHFHQITYGGVYFWHHPANLSAGGIGVEAEAVNVYGPRATIITRGRDYHFNTARVRLGSDHRTAALRRTSLVSREIFVSIRDLVGEESP